MTKSIKHVTRDQAEQILKDRYQDDWRFLVSLGLTSVNGITLTEVGVYEKRNLKEIQELFRETDAVVKYTGPEIPF